MRRFYLERQRDSTGMSGIGCVAEGVEFSDGEVGLRWLPHMTSMGIYRSIEDCMALHGHGGDTVIVWVDEVASSPLAQAQAMIVRLQREIEGLKRERDDGSELRPEA